MLLRFHYIHTLTALRNGRFRSSEGAEGFSDAQPGRAGVAQMPLKFLKYGNRSKNWLSN
jgi:hypothetical protein